MFLSVCFGIGIAAALFWLYAGQGLKDRWQTVWHWRRWPVCHHCRGWTGLALEDSRTRYVYDGPWFSPENPNAPKLYCRQCAEIHHEYWDGMWADYYGNLM